MNLHYDLAKAEITSHLERAEHRRTAKLARRRRRSGVAPRWQRRRST